MNRSHSTVKTEWIKKLLVRRKFMNKRFGEIVKLSIILTFGLLITFVMGCGGGGGGSVAAPTTSTSAGTVPASATGTTPAVATTVASPVGSTMSLQPSTTLTNASGQPVTGTITTSVTYATSPDKLPAAAVTQIMPDVAVFLDIDMGTVKTISPPLTAKMSVPGIAAGTLVDIYSFNGTDWVLETADVPVAADGTVSVNIGHLSIWAACKKKSLTISPPPTITTISPTLISQGTSGTFTINGTNLSGASLSITGTGGVTFGTTSVTATSIVVTATANASATTGARTLTVTTPGGTVTTTITVTSVTGATGGSGGTVF
jgi:hypothetical protein